MNILSNEEHREAFQAEVNEKNDKFIKSLSKIDQKKFTAIGKCLKILTEAGVQAALFAELPDRGDKGSSCWQYNNCGEFIKWENGKMSKESKIASSRFNHAVAYSFYNFLGTFSKNPFSLFATLTQVYYDYYYNGVEIPEIVALKNE